MPTQITLSISISISDDAIRGLLCSAFEGGSNYWYSNLEPAIDNVVPYDEFRDGGSQQGDTYWHWSQLMPLVEGCAVVFEDTEDNHKLHRLDLAAIKRGFQVMAERYPQHFADYLAEKGDATTGDVFLQCCVFGEVLYG